MSPGADAPFPSCGGAGWRSGASFGAVWGFGGGGGGRAVLWGLTPGSSVMLCDARGVAAIASRPMAPFPTTSAERRQRCGAEDT